MKAIDPIDSVGAAAPDLKRIAPASSPGGPSLDDLTQRFQSLMASQPDAASGVPEQGNAIGKVLESQEHLQHGADHAMEHLRRHGEQMTAEQHTVMSIEAARLQATSQFRLQAISSIASSTNKSLQTLLKNS